MQAVPPVLYIYPYQRQQIEPADLWQGVDDWWQWYAINSDGEGAYYDHEPFIEGNRWGWDGGASSGFKHDMTGVNWQMCAYCRPIEPTEDDKQAFATLESLRQTIGQATYVVMPADPALNGKTHTQEGPL